MLSVNAVQLVLPIFIILVNANEDAKRLYDDLMVNYNKHRRPAPAPNKPITIKLKLRLSQIIDVVRVLSAMSAFFLISKKSNSSSFSYIL